MNKIQVLFFATLKDRSGTTQLDLEIPSGSTILDLIDILENKIPGFSIYLNRAVISINLQFAEKEDLVPPDAEIAFFPPVSGGGEFPTVIEITSDAVDLDKLIREITLDSTGAVCSFSGIVRGKTDRDEPHVTFSLEYEAYVPMAKIKMLQIAGEIRKRWIDVEGIALVQRTGHLEAGEPSTHIICTSAHRDSGIFEAVRYGIDRLKEIVPIWKKEIGPDGKVWVEGEYFPVKGE
jgi:MoaE-MoaD fusion protein